eukprot:3348820-Karenia_brevis.AAC.1
MDDDDAVAAGSEMAESAGQASVVVRKSDAQRNLENTRASRGRADFHDPLTDPCMCGTNEPFESFYEGMGYSGEGVNEDGFRTTPRLHVQGADVPFCQFQRWGNDFLNMYTYEDFLDEANSYDVTA